jgi:hypothetical protein
MRAEPATQFKMLASLVNDLECGGKRYSARRRFSVDGPESGAATRDLRLASKRHPKKPLCPLCPVRENPEQRFTQADGA